MNSDILLVQTYFRDDDTYTGVMTHIPGVMTHIPGVRVSVKPGLWIVWWSQTLALDWPKQLYTDSERHQGYNSLSPDLPGVASLLLLSPRGSFFSISKRSKVMCIFNMLQQRWLWLTPCGYCKWFWASMTCIYCFLWRPHASVGGFINLWLSSG